MKVILTQEIKGKGGEGDVVDVARGYAVNYLLPRKLAIEATPGNLKQLAARKGNILAREESRFAEARSVAAALDAKKVTIEAKAGEEGRLFGSITTQMIEDAITGQLATKVDRRKMDVHGHIKQLGTYTVTVQIYRDVKAEVLVEVIAEGAPVAQKRIAEPPAEEAVSEAPIEASDAEVAEAETDSAGITDSGEESGT
ncbi:MAG: 50S ribosomal protein L9 [Clostridiales bacterium]|nr:50S ribosomal protein L9 [Clostridiales bacterium]